jgi:hypothetical protein
VVEKLQARGAEFAQVIHPTALVTARTAIAEGVVLVRSPAPAPRPASAGS